MWRQLHTVGISRSQRYRSVLGTSWISMYFIHCDSIMDISLFKDLILATDSETLIVFHVSRYGVVYWLESDSFVCQSVLLSGTINILMNATKIQTDLVLWNEKYQNVCKQITKSQDLHVIDLSTYVPKIATNILKLHDMMAISCTFPGVYLILQSYSNCN